MRISILFPLMKISHKFKAMIVPQKNEFPLHQACGDLEHDTACRLVQGGCTDGVNVTDNVSSDVRSSGTLYTVSLVITQEGNLPLHSVLSSRISVSSLQSLVVTINLRTTGKY